ncbi:hypothetical protein NIES2101_06830 [Calothrix sp. HK-06]|nr:hypothetical protein NIES2101_06830 [Calothrix sp. HK-06]
MRASLIKSSLLMFFLLLVKPATAGIIPDGTLPTNSKVIQQGNTSLIEEGTIKGTNLFHSFNDFSIFSGNTAYFNNSLNIQNIISRVTGTSVSNIDGLIRANGSANLFLLNPNGIIFGQNAKLDIGGSFIGTSANSMKFNDGFEFKATNSESTPLLTVSTPIGLQFGANPGNITNFSRAISQNGEIIGLSVLSGATLALIGGQVTIDGGTLTAPGGNIELGAISGNNTVNLVPTSFGWKLGYEKVSSFQDIGVINNATLASNFNGRGNITITGNNIDILSSRIQAGINSGLQLNNQPGDIALNSQGNTTVDAGVITNRVDGIGDAGNINLTAQSLVLNNGAEITANNFGEGNAGNININATDTISLSGVGANGSSTVIGANLFGAKGNGGEITVNTANLSLTKGATIVAHTFGEGNAGNIEVNASNNINISGLGSNGFTSGIGSQVFPEAVGNGGKIVLNAPIATLSEGANVVAHTFGQGNAGNIEINAQKVFLDGLASNGESSGIGSAVFGNAKGNAGEIVINTNSLSVTDSASLFVATFGQGNAGSITINASYNVIFDGVGANGRSSNAFSTVEEKSSGDGKEINIRANTLNVNNGAVIGTTTRGKGDGGNINIKVNRLEAQAGGEILSTSRSSGNAGNITVNATESINFSGNDPNFSQRLARIGRPIVRNEGAGSGLYANTDEKSTGKGGNINVTTRRFTITDGAIVNTSAFGQGSTGDIKITASDLFMNAADIASSSLFGQGGNINLQIAETSILRNQSTISTRAGTLSSGGGDGGNIRINANVLTALENSSINANAFQGRGGNIQISASGLLLSPNSSITASSQRGINGNIQINTPDVNPEAGLIELPNNFSDRSNLIAQVCPALRGNYFTITGRSGLPANPSDTIRTNLTETIDWVAPNFPKTKPEKVTNYRNLKPKTTTKIIEVTSWVKNKLGEVMLVASTPTPSIQTINTASINLCQQ